MKDDCIKSTVEFSTEWTLYKMPFFFSIYGESSKYVQQKTELSFDIAKVSGANYDIFQVIRDLCYAHRILGSPGGGGGELRVATKEAILS